ncbi:MAG: hypothetical protein LAQ30_28590 [Acidobacteriia bacterium]|nr:hypothetical protein [Terriglobia bacterium]
MDKPLRAWKISALVIFCILDPLATWAVVRFALTLDAEGKWGFSNGEVVTVLLTGLTISIAMMAVVIGLIAIWGYHAIKDEAREIARGKAKEEVNAYLAGNEVKALLVPIVTEAVASAVSSLQLASPGANLGTETAIDNAPIIESGEEHGKFDQYPNEENGGDQK